MLIIKEMEIVRPTRITNIQKFNFERIAKRLQKENAVLRTRIRDEKTILRQVIDDMETRIFTIKYRYNILLLFIFDCLAFLYFYHNNEIFKNFVCQ